MYSTRPGLYSEIVIIPTLISVSIESSRLMRSLTVYVPASWYVNTGCDSVESLVALLSKSHTHSFGLPIEESSNETVNGAVPDNGAAEKAASNRSLGRLALNTARALFAVSMRNDTCCSVLSIMSPSQ